MLSNSTENIVIMRRLKPELCTTSLASSVRRRAVRRTFVRRRAVRRTFVRRRAVRRTFVRCRAVRRTPVRRWAV